MQSPGSNTISYTFGSEVSTVAGSAEHLVLLVAAVAGVEPLVAGGAGEAGLVPGLEGRLQLFSKVDCLVTLWTSVAAAPPWLGGISWSRRRDRSCCST